MVTEPGSLLSAPMAPRQPARISRRSVLLALVGATAALSLPSTAESVQAAPAACGVPPREPLPFPAPDPMAAWTATPGPATTTVTLSSQGYMYSVDGYPEAIRGMGYNPPTAGVTPDMRQQRLLQDFSLMAAASVNTVIGWNPSAIDALALDLAWQAGLGVALPFDVDFTLDVRDWNNRDAFMGTVLAWVEQYRQHPALRMWAIGNEVLQRSVPPTWCSTGPSAEQGAWAEAWSSLLLETADLVHAADPLHPVLYREAEDSYTSWLERALAANPGSRPWLVYGVNAYTPRLTEILDTWPQRGIQTSLLVSEYAPMNVPHGQRADHYRQQWATIRAYRGYVLGGAVYVWSTDGPEEVDREFGLVDASGQPVDDALDTISELYRADAQVSRQTPGNEGQA